MWLVLVDGCLGTCQLAEHDSRILNPAEGLRRYIMTVLDDYLASHGGN